MRTSYLVAIFLVIIVSYFFLTQHDTSIQEPLPPSSTDTNLTGDISSMSGDTNSLEIRVPSDTEAFRQAMIDHVQVGGPDPVPETERVTQSTGTLASSGEDISAMILAAANVYPTGGGPEKVTITSLYTGDDTAYLVLNIDRDGRAGVSLTQALVHALVEQTLYDLSDIDTLVRGYPPFEFLQDNDYPGATTGIVADLQAQDASALIGVEGVLGGTIAFRDPTQIRDTGEGRYLAYREDGHILGYALLQHHDDGEWELLHNYTDL